RAGHRRGSRGAGPAPDPGRFPEPAEGERRRPRAPGHRSREAFAVYTRLLRAATSDRQSDADFEQNAAIARGLAASDQSYYARATRAAVLSHRDWLAANETRHRMHRAWAELFPTDDLLLSPVAGGAAFPPGPQGE